jgi:hypothetical protein
MQNWITDLEKNEGAAAMLKVCWLVCPCSSVPALFPLFYASVGLLRSTLCLRPFLSTGFCFGSFLFLQILLQGMKQRPKGSPYLFWHLFHLFSLLSTLRLLPFSFPFSFLSQWRKDQGKKTYVPLLSALSSPVFFLVFLFLFFPLFLSLFW